MVNIKSVLKSDKGKIIVSIILGFGLASLFRKACHDRKCLNFKAVTNSDIKGKIYKFNNKCYTFKENAVTCDSRKRQVSV